MEYLSAAYSAIGLYSPEHPLVVALSEAAADASAFLDRCDSCETPRIDVSASGFAYRGTSLMTGVVSPLAGDLHALNAIEMTIAGAISAAGVHRLLTTVHETRRSGGTLDRVNEVAQSIAGHPLRLSVVPAERLSARASSCDTGVPGQLVTDSSIAALLRDCPDDPVRFAELLTDALGHDKAAETEVAREWLLSQTSGVAHLPVDESSARQLWLTECIRRLDPDVRMRLLQTTPEPDPRWLLSAARLAPVWPIDELIAALETLAGDVATLRGSGRLLFTQLLTLASDSSQTERIEAVIESWGAHRSDSSLFASAGAEDASKTFRSDEYAEELMTHAQRSRVAPAVGLGLDVESDDALSVRAAEIAFELSREDRDSDVAAVGVARTAESLIRSHRTDLILQALTSEWDGDESDRTASPRRRRLRAVLRKPDSIRALLDSLHSTRDTGAVVRLLDLAGEHAAPLALEFAANTEHGKPQQLALAWFRGLGPETRASALAEFLSASPQHVGMLEPLCDGIETLHIGFGIDHLIAANHPEHTAAALRVLGWCAGSWPASVVHHITTRPDAELRASVTQSLTSGPVHTRSDTIARVLCSWVIVSGVPVADASALVSALTNDQGVAERAFVELLGVIRERYSMIARGDAEPLLDALSGFEEVSSGTQRMLGLWRSPKTRCLRLIGSIGLNRRAHGRGEKRCA
ncbi:MAG: hypothetical protein AAFS11_06065 [Planctomycetota bacterium]